MVYENIKDLEEQISVIKKAIEESDGRLEIISFLYRMGNMMIWFGIVTSLICAVKYYSTVTGKVKLGVIVAILSINLLLFGCFKAIATLKRERELNLPLLKYFRRIFNNSFMRIDIPLELTATVFMIHFILTKQYEYLIPVTLMWPGILFGYFGASMGERIVTSLGYGYLVLFSITMAVTPHYPLANVFFMFGLYMTLCGFMLRIAYKKEMLSWANTKTPNSISIRKSKKYFRLMQDLKLFPIYLSTHHAVSPS